MIFLRETVLWRRIHERDSNLVVQNAQKIDFPLQYSGFFLDNLADQATYDNYTFKTQTSSMLAMSIRLPGLNIGRNQD
jgi:hypothetical protein